MIEDMAHTKGPPLLISQPVPQVNHSLHQCYWYVNPLTIFHLLLPCTWCSLLILNMVAQATSVAAPLPTLSNTQRGANMKPPSIFTLLKSWDSRPFLGPLMMLWIWRGSLLNLILCSRL